MCSIYRTQIKSNQNHIIIQNILRSQAEKIIAESSLALEREDAAQRGTSLISAFWLRYHLQLRRFQEGVWLCLAGWIVCCAYEILTPYKASQSGPWVAPYTSIVGVRQDRLHSPTVFVFLEKNVRCFIWFRAVVERRTITNLRFADDVDLVAQGRKTSSNNTWVKTGERFPFK